MSQREQVFGVHTVADGRFIALKRLDWTSHAGENRVWESAERVGFPGAVLMMPLLVPSERYLVIRQFRPPARGFVYEFPAGIMEPGETPEVAAARELREETGYIAGRLKAWPAAFTTPGMADESVHMVAVEIDENAPENANPQTEFDASEHIETFFVPKAELGSFYARETAAGAMFDAKLAAFILAREA